MNRHILTDEQQQQARNNFNNLCYVCVTPLEGYDSTEVEYDHIYASADGYSQCLYGYAPVHASVRPGMKNCHRDKERKSPYETYLIKR